MLRDSKFYWKLLFISVNIVFVTWLVISMQSKIISKPITTGLDLLQPESYAKLLANKKSLSIADSMTNFLACIATDRRPETNVQWGAEFRLQLIDCIKLYVPVEKQQLDSFKSINWEHKYFLPFDKEYYAKMGTECIWLTIGVGNNTDAEKEFKKMYDKCRIFGIEANPERVADFANFGTLIQTGVGVSATQLSPSLILEHKGTSNLTLRPFDEVLEKDVKSKILYYATIDIDGHEYPILNEFKDFGKYQSYGVVICQLDAELHTVIPGVLTESNFALAPFVREFFSNSSTFLPIYAASYGSAVKMTIINVKNVECEKAFRFSKYFERS